MYKSVRLVLVLKITSDRYSSYLWVHLCIYLCNSIANNLPRSLYLFFHLLILSYTACSWRSLWYIFPIKLEKYLLTCFYLHIFGISLCFPVEHREINPFSCLASLSFLVWYDDQLSLIVTYFFNCFPMISTSIWHIEGPFWWGLLLRIVL